MRKGVLVLLTVCSLLLPSVLVADECMDGDCDNGTGTGFTEDGKIYEGEWKDGYPHGKGTKFISKTEKIKGEWVKGKLVKELREENNQD